MQFDDGQSEATLCPVCRAVEVPRRTTRGPINYCGKVCASQARYATRYQGTMAGPLDRPTLKEKTKLK